MIIKNILAFLIYFALVFIVLAVGFFAYLKWFQPAFNFPKPTGKYAVGIKTYHWIDNQRKETFSEDPGHPHRELMVKIWYPAEDSLREIANTPYAPYFIDYFKNNKSLIWLLLTRPMFTYAKPALPLVHDVSQFPVIIFSPGFRGILDGNTSKCEELASHGYIVIGTSHPYDNSVVQFPDGRIIDGLASIAKRKSRSGEGPMQEAKIIDDSAEIWFADIQFILKQLDHLAQDKSSIFYQRVDQNNIGMVGHSMGGSTAIQTALFDDRIKAIVNLDGALFGPKITKKLDKPCMVLLSESGVKFYERPFTQREWKTYGINSAEEERTLKETSYIPILAQLEQSAQHDFYTFVIKGTGHFDFSDLALLKVASPIVNIIAILKGSIIKVGPINGTKATKIINEYLLAFFNKYLKEIPSELLDSKKKKYAEVELR